MLIFKGRLLSLCFIHGNGLTARHGSPWWLYEAGCSGGQFLDTSGSRVLPAALRCVPCSQHSMCWLAWIELNCSPQSSFMLAESEV